MFYRVQNKKLPYNWHVFQLLVRFFVIERLIGHFQLLMIFLIVQLFGLVSLLALIFDHVQLVLFHRKILIFYVHVANHYCFSKGKEKLHRAFVYADHSKQRQFKINVIFTLNQKIKNIFPYYSHHSTITFNSLCFLKNTYWQVDTQNIYNSH